MCTKFSYKPMIHAHPSLYESYGLKLPQVYYNEDEEAFTVSMLINHNYRKSRLQTTIKIPFCISKLVDVWML